MKQDFETFFAANERRIHYQIHRLGILSHWYDTFYTEGMTALWKAYQDFDGTKGNIGTYLNFRIRYALIDHIRKKKREETNAETLLQHNITEMTNGTRNRHADTELLPISSIPLTDTSFWDTIQSQLTANQWKWVEYFIIADLSIREIMELENVSADAVKGWGRAVRRKLQSDTFKQFLKENIHY